MGTEDGLELGSGILPLERMGWTLFGGGGGGHTPIHSIIS